MIKAVPTQQKIKDDNVGETSKQITKVITDIETASQYYKLGDLVDVRLPDTGAWYEAKIIKIFRQENNKQKLEITENELFFRVQR